MTRLNETNSAATFSTTSTTRMTLRGAAPDLEHAREAEHRADDVGAGVADHEPLAEVVAEETRERAHHRRDRDADRAGPREDRDRDPRDEPDLDDPARARGRAGCRGSRPAR